MNLIASFYLTNYHYPFWNYPEKPNAVKYTEAWRKSVEKLGLTSIVFVDEENSELKQFENKKFQIGKVEGTVTNQIDTRWSIAHQFLLLNEHIEYFFMTDISDVTILKNPFEMAEKGKIYVGDEKTTFGESDWIANRVRLINSLSCRINSVAIASKPLLNCGIFGGHRNTILPVLEEIASKIKTYGVKDDTVDMVALNEVLHINYPEQIVYGSPINTEFWKWDFNNKECFFQHK